MSTFSPLKRRKRFSICCPGIRHSVSIIEPRNEEVAIFIRLLDCNKAAATSFIEWRSNIRASRDQILVKLIDIFNTDKKVNSTTTSQHRLKILRERNSQRAAAQFCHWRFGAGVDRLDFHPEHLLVK